MKGSLRERNEFDNIYTARVTNRSHNLDKPGISAKGVCLFHARETGVFFLNKII